MQIRELLCNSAEVNKFRDSAILDTDIKSIILIAAEFSNIAQIKGIKFRVLYTSELRTLASKKDYYYYNVEHETALNTAPIGLNIYMSGSTCFGTLSARGAMALGSVYERINDFAIELGYSTHLVRRRSMSEKELTACMQESMDLCATVCIGYPAICPVRSHVGDLQSYMLEV